MAAAAQRAEQEWLKARKMRSAILKELELVRREEPNKDAADLGRFETVDKLLEGFRLSCVTIPWLDIRFAKKHETDDLLWTTHVFVTTVYRKLIDRLDKEGRTVQKRKVEKLYAPYLKVSQEFYQGYLQRVCAMYEIQDIRRIPRDAELREMTVLPEYQVVGSAATEVRDLVIESVHKTLCCLGDLSRYRVLMRPDRRDWKRPLTIYRLANDLLPVSGYAHHQCGVIADEQQDHLGVIYHFYRALASDHPHPHAMSNLEKKLEKWLKVQPLDRTKSHDDEWLAYWFLKLHAYFYKGEDFRQYEELEREVLYRFKSALEKNVATPPDEGPSTSSYDVKSSWLRIILVNICAYHVGLDKSQKRWSEEASRSCQFILRLNIRTIYTIIQFLTEQLHPDLPGEMEKNAVGKPKPKLPQSRWIFNEGAEEALSLLRVYVTWLYYYRADLVRYREFLEPHFGVMCTALGQFLTTICQVGAPFADIIMPMPALGLEAAETVGLHCLNGADLPEVCRLGYYVSRAPKSRSFEDESSYTDNMTWSRLYGIKLCAQELAKSEFPLKMDLMEMGQYVFPMFSAEATSPVSPDPVHSPVEERQSRQSHQPSQSLGADSSNKQQQQQQQQQQALLETPSPVVPTAVRSGFAPARETQAPQAASDAENSVLDSRIYDMVSGFLAPPEAPPTQRLSQRSQETSYGMGSTTAEDIFGAVASMECSPSSPVASARALPSLPWDYFYTPAPVGTNRPLRRDSSMADLSNAWDAEAGPSSRPDSSGGALGALQGASLLGGGGGGGGGGGVFTSTNMLKSLESPLQNRQEPLDAILSMQHQQQQQQQHRPSIGSPLATVATDPQLAPASEQAKAKPKTLSAQERFNESLRAHGIRGKLAADAAERAAERAAAAAEKEKSAVQSPLGSPVQFAGSMSASASASAPSPPNAVMSSFGSQMAFSGNMSSLPPVNSPWGLPYHQQTISMLMPSYAPPSASGPSRFPAADPLFERSQRGSSYG